MTKTCPIRKSKCKGNECVWFNISSSTCKVVTILSDLETIKSDVASIKTDVSSIDDKTPAPDAVG